MKTFSNEQEKEPKTKAELAKIRERTELFIEQRFDYVLFSPAWNWPCRNCNNKQEHEIKVLQVAGGVGSFCPFCVKKISDKIIDWAIRNDDSIAHDVDTRFERVDADFAEKFILESAEEHISEFKRRKERNEEYAKQDKKRLQEKEARRVEQLNAPPDTRPFWQQEQDKKPDQQTETAKTIKDKKRSRQPEENEG